PRRALLVIAEAGVDQHGVTRRAHHEAVEAEDQPVVAVQPLGREPAALRRDAVAIGRRQQVVEWEDLNVVDDLYDAGVAEIEHGERDPGTRAPTVSTASPIALRAGSRLAYSRRHGSARHRPPHSHQARRSRP